MRTLLRTTASLLRRYPILWLPVAIAEVVTFIIRRCEGALLYSLRRQLLLWLTESHSVFGGSLEHTAPTAQVMYKLSLIITPITLICGFILNALLWSALIATAAILKDIAQTGSGTLRDATSPVASSVRRILGFSLLLTALNALFNFLTGFLAPLIPFRQIQDTVERNLSLSPSSATTLEQSHLIDNLVSHIWVLPFTLCIAYVIAPFAVRLLQPPDSIPAPHQARNARIAMILALLTGSALNFLAAMVESSLFPHILAQPGLALSSFFAITSFLTTMLTALPYVPLFIAFYLIANPTIPFLTTTPKEDPTPPQPESLPSSTSA